MSEFLLDKYYDLTCEHCSRTRSESYSKGKHHDKHDLIKQAKAEGWSVIDDKNVCPICHKLLNDDSWKSIALVAPPVRDDLDGLDSATDEKYIVLTREGHVIQGKIYKNRCSCSGYAVYIGPDYMINNVTHWVPDNTASKDVK